MEEHFHMDHLPALALIMVAVAEEVSPIAKCTQVNVAAEVEADMAVQLVMTFTKNVGHKLVLMVITDQENVIMSMSVELAINFMPALNM